MPNQPDRHLRASLPIPDRPGYGQPLLPPEGAPNVLVILLDDVGFGCSRGDVGNVSESSGR